MTVINPKSISGITSITMPSGADNVLTIHTTDGTERFRIDSSGNVKVGSAATISPDGDLFVTGVCTATTLSGAASGLTGALPAISAANLTNVPAANITGTLPAISAANLTNVPAANITGTLPAISAANLTNVPAANVVGVHTSLNVTGSTIVGGGVTISESGIEASGIGITCANINGTQIGGRRNIIINGAMNIAQRGTSSTSTSYQTVDRMFYTHNGVDEAATQSQHTLTSSDTGPYGAGFRHSYHITNGNQTSGIAADHVIVTRYLVEAQDIAKSGWNYTSSSSFITFSFWVKASVAQTYYVRLYAPDGTPQGYAFAVALSANTWTKVTKTIAGNSNLQFDNNSEVGFTIEFNLYRGTDSTTSGYTLDTWAAYSATSRVPDMTGTWYTTNDATFEYTGLQLEVGSQATPFEHRSFGEELALCERYFYKIIGDTNDHTGIMGYLTSAGESRNGLHLPVSMRTVPTYAGSGNAQIDSTPDTNDFSLSTNATLDGAYHTTNCPNSLMLQCTHGGSAVGGHGGGIRFRSDGAFISLSAEL